MQAFVPLSLFFFPCANPAASPRGAGEGQQEVVHPVPARPLRQAPLSRIGGRAGGWAGSGRRARRGGWHWTSRLRPGPITHESQRKSAGSWWGLLRSCPLQQAQSFLLCVVWRRAQVARGIAAEPGGQPHNGPMRLCLLASGDLRVRGWVWRVGTLEEEEHPSW